MQLLNFLLAIPFVATAAGSSTLYYSAPEATKVPTGYTVSTSTKSTLTRLNKKITPNTKIVEKIYFYSNKYSVPADVIMNVVSGESGFNVCAKNPNEESYGLAQIFLTAHPEITKEQACDPDFALEFMAKNISLGRGNMWTVYHNLYGEK